MEGYTMFLRFLALLLLLCLPVSLAHSAATHGVPDVQQELQSRDADRFAGLVISGCLHATSGSYTTAAFACTAYGSSGTYIAQAAAAVNYQTLGAAASDTCWLGVVPTLTGNVGTYTRQPGTNYLADCTSGSRPAPPAGGLLLAQVTLSGGSITAVTSLRPGSAVVPVIRTADLPAACCTGRRVWLVDGVRGEWLDTGTQWARVDPIVDMRRDFNMRCDGSTEESATLQAAISALTATYNTLRLPEGTCIIGSEVLGVSNMTLLGHGQGRTILQQKASTQINGTNQAMLYFGAKTNVTVQGITWDGNYANQGAIVRKINLLYFSSGTEIRIYDNEFKNGYGVPGGSGVLLAFGATSNRVYIRGNRLHDTGTAVTFPSDCVYTSGFAINVQQNIFENCTDTGTVFESKSTAASNPADNTVIAGNSYSGCVQSINVSSALASSYTEGVTVANNFVEDANTAQAGAIYFWNLTGTTNPIRRVAITGNVCHGTTVGYCIFLFNASGVTVSGNEVSAAGMLNATPAAWSGIAVFYSDNMLITGNNVWGNGNVGIILEGLLNSHISNNYVWGNGLVTANAGIYLGKYTPLARESSTVTFTANFSTGNQTGLSLQNVTDTVHVLGNDFTNNTNDPGLTVGGSVTNVRKYGNLVHNGATAVTRAEENDAAILKTATFSELSGGTTGTVFVCSDCQPTTPCTGSGSGAVAQRFNSLWNCGPLAGSVAFAALGTPSNGVLLYCQDCTIANPCAGGGTGALAKRISNTWICN